MNADLNARHGMQEKMPKCSYTEHEIIFLKIKFLDKNLKTDIATLKLKYLRRESPSKGTPYFST